MLPNNLKEKSRLQRFLDKLDRIRDKPPEDPEVPLDKKQNPTKVQNEEKKKKASDQERTEKDGEKVNWKKKTTMMRDDFRRSILQLKTELRESLT